MRAVRELKHPKFPTDEDDLIVNDNSLYSLFDHIYISVLSPSMVIWHGSCFSKSNHVIIYKYMGVGTHKG